MAGAASQTVLNLKLSEGKDAISQKDFVKPYGATTVTAL